METDITIVGAGACGLMAGRMLAEGGRKVLILEARERTGGRIYTLHEGTPREMGAEFIHGDLPVTIALLRDAGLKYHKTADEMWHADEQGLQQEESFIEGWEVLLEKLKELHEEMSIVDFLEKNFPGPEHRKLRESVLSYAEGYDTAEPEKASAIALREEWKEEAVTSGYRIDGGYGGLTEYLEKEFTAAGGVLKLSTTVTEIRWGGNEVTIIAADGQAYKAKKVLVTVPVSILQADGSEQGNIQFSPALPEYKEAAKEIGYGSVIKILMEFRESFWEKGEADLGKAGFIFSNEVIPTWWTQNPKGTHMLTGWLGGPKAKKMSELKDEDLIMTAVESLASIFKLSTESVLDLLKEWYIADWNKEAFSRGSYSYASIGAQAARVVLTTPVKDTIYFAGEALIQGIEAGTVEAALRSGKAVAERILSAK